MTSFSAQSRPRQNPRVAAREVDGQAVVVVLDERALHRLDEVGSRIWSLCDGRSIAEIAAVVAAEYEVSEEQALQDAVPFVEELHRVGAVLGEGE